MSKLKPFGVGGLSHNAGYTLPLLVSHIGSLLDEEVGFDYAVKGPRAKRIDLVEDALNLLNEAIEMGGEDES